MNYFLVSFSFVVDYVLFFYWRPIGFEKRARESQREQEEVEKKEAKKHIFPVFRRGRGKKNSRFIFFPSVLFHARSFFSIHCVLLHPSLVSSD